MSDLIWLSRAQMKRIEPYFPLSHGVPRVDDRRVISGIISSSGMACAGAMRRRITARTRQSITALSAGAGSACSTRSSRRWRPRVARPTG